MTLLDAHLSKDAISDCVAALDSRRALSKHRVLFRDDDAHVVAPVDIIVRESETQRFHAGIWVHAGALHQVLTAIAVTKTKRALTSSIDVINCASTMGRIDLYGPDVHRVLERVIALPPSPPLISARADIDTTLIYTPYTTYYTTHTLHNTI